MNQTGQIDKLRTAPQYPQYPVPELLYLFKMLEHVLAALKSGGRLVVVDMSPHKTANRPRADQAKNHVLAPDLAVAEISAAGFEIVSRDDHFIDNPDEESTRWMIVFRKPSDHR